METKKGHKEVRIERRIPTVETANQMSIVKTMMFATTHVKDGHGISPTFWVGTASGTVFFFALTVPGKCRIISRDRLYKDFLDSRRIVGKEKSASVDFACYGSFEKLT